MWILQRSDEWGGYLENEAFFKTKEDAERALEVANQDNVYYTEALDPYVYKIVEVVFDD